MADIFQFWGQDLTPSACGDLLWVNPLSSQDPATANGNDEGTQRIYRRLMTGAIRGNSLSGEDIFDPQYGAGIPQRIGDVIDTNLFVAVITSQMYKESAVARTPAPQIQVTAALPASCFVDIFYYNAATGVPVSLAFPVG